MRSKPCSVARVSRCLAVLIAGCVLPSAGPAAAAEPASLDWRAGVAKVNITPEEFMWMSGYGDRNKPASGKLTDLWAKALVLQDGSGQRAVMVTLDLVGVDRELSQSVCGTLHERHGLRREQLALCCSHTHTGPALRQNLSPLHYLQVDPEEQRRIERYTDSVRQKIVDVVGLALERLEPARLSWGSGIATFAANRRENRPEEEVPARRAEGTLRGPTDHDVPVLAVRNPTGELRAVLFGYACHATVLSFYQWSADYPGFAQMELEANHPGCMALFWAGCGADQNPLPRRTVELARHYGRRLADAVDTVLLTSRMTDLPSRLELGYAEIELRLAALPARKEIEEQAQSSDRFVAARAQMLLRQLDGGQPLSETYPYPIGLWRLGDTGGVKMVLLGGEVVVDYALRLKTELTGLRTWVVGYANDVMAYIPSRRVLAEGGYEGGGAMVYYGLPTTWSSAVEQQIIEEVHRQIGQVSPSAK